MWSDIIQHGVKLIECSYSQVRSLAPPVVIFVQKISDFWKNFGEAYLNIIFRILQWWFTV